MTNEVDVDEAALRAAAAAVDVGTEPAAGDDPGNAQESEAIVDETARAEAFARQSAPVVGKLLRVAAAIAVPNWTITEAQHQALAESTAYALALWFPTEIPPKWAALLGVGMAAYSIVESNRDPETGELRPRVKPPREASVSDGAATAA